MRTKILSVFLFVTLPGVLLAGEAKVISMSGTVEVRQTREGQWAPASENMEIAEGGALRTGNGGAAVLLMPNKTKVWFKENTSLEIEQRQTLASRLALVFGKIKVRVPHLMRREKFEVRTPAAVCAVRGTEFTMGTTEEGKMELQVLFGEVKLKFAVPPEKGRDEFDIPQGQGLALDEKGKAAKPALLTSAAEREALENWNPGLNPQERQKDMQQKENDRAQIKEYAAVTTSAENTVKSFLNVVKESDLEAGRTLTDVHGNLVRVDQRMVRPDASTIQFYNLVKRPVYNNDGSSYSDGGFKYNGGVVTNRLDYMAMSMNFSKDLPQRIEEWPSFFNDNDIKPQWASFVLANRTANSNSEVFFAAENYTYDAGRDELVNNTQVIGIGETDSLHGGADEEVLITGVIKDDTSSGLTAIEGLDKISKLQVTADLTNSGALKYTGTHTGDAVGGTGGKVVWAGRAVNTSSYNSTKGVDNNDSTLLKQYQADKYQVGNSGDYLWFTKENYVINNGGSVQTVGNYTNSSKDPFSLLKDSALESVMSIKKYDASANIGRANAGISDDDYFSFDSAKQGIDIVFIPDLMVAAVQRMLPAITNLKD
mgnify:CR=1 FL=1